MRKILSILAFCLGVTACVYPYTPDLEEAPEGVLSVDASINIGGTSTVRLGALLSLFTSSNSNWQQPDFSDADVWVEDDAGTRYPGVRNGASPDIWSSYLPNSDPRSPIFSISTEGAPADRKYRLCIEALDGLYTSDWSDIPEAPVIEQIEFLPDDNTVTVAVSVDGGPGGTGYLLLSYDEAWEFHVDFEQRYTFDPRTMTVSENYSPDRSLYWCWTTLDYKRTYPVDYSSLSDHGIKSYPLLSFPRTDSRNHRRYCVNVSARTLSQASYRFLKNLDESSEGGDNLFTPNPGEIAGNLRCESDPDRTVLGYVIVSRTATKRAWLDSRYRKSTPPSVSSLLFLLPKDWGDFYGRGYLPLWENPNENYDPKKEGPYGWGSARCYDCVAAGGTLTPPDYWYSNTEDAE